MSQNGKHASDLLDAYLDGALAPTERAAFEQRLAQDAKLRLEVDQQRAIDAALRRLFTLPAAGKAQEALKAAQGAIAAEQTQRRKPLLLRMPVYARAALIVLVVGLGAAGYSFYRFLSLSYMPPEVRVFVPLRTVVEAYQEKLDHNFMGETECDPTNELEFAGNIWERTGQGLLMTLPLPADVKPLGFSGRACFSPKTLLMMVRVGDPEQPLEERSPVIVFMDSLKDDKKPTVAPETGLHLFRKEVGAAVLYELTPLHASHVIDLFYDPHWPVEKYEEGAGKGW